MARNIGKHFEPTEKSEGVGQEPFDQSRQIMQPEAAGDATNGGDNPDEKLHRTKGKGAKVALIVVLVVLAGVAGVFGYLYFGDTKTLTPEEEAQLMENGTFYNGIQMMDVDLSGKTMAQARTELGQKVQQTLDAISLSYTVNGEMFTLNAQDLGAAMDVEPGLAQAMLYGRNGGHFERKDAIAYAAEQGMRIETPDVTYSEQSIADAVAKNGTKMQEAAVDATVNLKTISDEDKKWTDYEVMFTDGKSGFTVNQEKLVADLYAAAVNGTLDPIQAEIKEVPPEVRRADLEKMYSVRGVFQTRYAESASGRRYNIWKMALWEFWTKNFMILEKKIQKSCFF
jgi:hypothetical protein